MRLFVAIELAPAVQQQLTKATQQLRGKITGKWVEPPNLHLTLAFIGEVKELLVPALTQTLTQAVAARRPFQLSFNALTAIPTAARARLLALSVNYPPAYKQLQQTVLGAVKKLKLVAKSHQPHLTLVRLKHPLTNLPAMAPLNLKLEIREISLMQSILTPKGPIYQRLGALKLASEAPLGRLRPNIAICVINPKNEVLLIRSSRHNPRDWQFPQGGVEDDESLEQAAKRELKEEVGIEEVRLMQILERIYKYHWSKRFLNKTPGHSTAGFIGQEQSLALVKVDQARPRLSRNPREASAYKWIHYSKLLKSISPVRRSLARIAMVELNKLMNNQA